DLRRHEQKLPQYLNRLVYREARCIRCKFEQRSGGLAYIERREIFAVVNIDGAGIQLRQFLLCLFHVTHIGGTESHMIGNSRTGNARPETTCIAHIDGIARIREKAIYRAFFGRRPETEIALDETGGLFRRFGQNGRSTQTPDRESCWNAFAFPRIVGGKIAADQLDDHTVRVTQAQDRFTEFLNRPFGRHMIAQGALEPEADGGAINRERYFTDLPVADTPPGAVLPHQKRYQ